MSGIDWSKATIGCIGALVAKKGNIHYPKVTFALSMTQEGCGFKGVACEGYNICAYADSWEWVPRPSLPAWTGAGLPPVGTVCEYFAKTEQRWIPVVMIGTFRGSPVLGCEETGVVGQLDTEVYQLRPIRTPEQIAAEERESHVQGMLCHFALGGTRRDLAEALYDAGYRLIKACDPVDHG
jgi:hypothetical protein